MEVVTKYDMIIKQSDLESYLKTLKNKVYKLLPLKEEGLEWSKYLQTIMIEITGLNDLIVNKPMLISLLAKLESLNTLDEFLTYRKTVFECLSLIEEMI